jgi:hypothetical protein
LFKNYSVLHEFCTISHSIITIPYKLRTINFLFHSETEVQKGCVLPTVSQLVKSESGFKLRQRDHQSLYHTVYPQMVLIWPE